MSTNPSRPHPDALIGERYRLVRLIGRGGMAEVHEAVDEQLQRAVAIKRVRGASPTDRARFDAEARVVASLSHPGLVAVYDAGEDGEWAYAVLELVDGPSLAARVAEQGPLPPHEVATIGDEVADALGHVHERGIVHRDVTPSNVLCGPDGRARLTDFGIARLVDSTRITAASTTIGTAAYMAPEQLHGAEVTPAADVYALGLVLLEALTGRPGFAGSPSEAAVARLARQPDTATGVPVAWRGLLAWMTARQPEDRATIDQVRAELQRLRRDATAAPATAVAAVSPPVSDAPTIEMRSEAGGTAMMPAASPLPVVTGTRRLDPRRAVGVAVAAIVAVATLVALAGSSDSDLDLAPVRAVSTTEPGLQPPPTSAPSTTVATTAAEPQAERTPPGQAKRKEGAEAGEKEEDD